MSLEEEEASKTGAALPLNLMPLGCMPSRRLLKEAAVQAASPRAWCPRSCSSTGYVHTNRSPQLQWGDLGDLGTGLVYDSRARLISLLCPTTLNPQPRGTICFSPLSGQTQIFHYTSIDTLLRLQAAVACLFYARAHLECSQQRNAIRRNIRIVTFCPRRNCCLCEQPDRSPLVEKPAGPINRHPSNDMAWTT